MNNYELIQKGAAVWRAATKASGLSQREIAKSLSVSQSHISKISNGLAIPSAPEWLEFAQLTNVPAQSYLKGYIDSGQPIDSSESGRIGDFILPERYTKDRTSSVRTSRIYLRYLKKQVGSNKTDDFIRSCGMDPDYFVNHSHKFNPRFNFDVLDFLLKNRFVDSSSVESLTEPLKKASFYGHLEKQFLYSRKPLDQIQLFMELFNRFDLNHEYRIEHRASKFIDISVSPTNQIGSLLNSELKKFFVSYFKWSFRNIASIGNDHRWEIKSITLEDRYTPREKCIYRIVSQSPPFRNKPLSLSRKNNK